MVTDYDDSITQFISIVDVDKCGNPIKLSTRWIESGFQPGNPLQFPLVSQSIMIKMK